MMQTPHLLKPIDANAHVGSKPEQTTGRQVPGAEFTLAIAVSAPALIKPSPGTTNVIPGVKIPAISRQISTDSGGISPETPPFEPQPANQATRAADTATMLSSPVSLPQVAAQEIPIIGKTEASSNEDGLIAMPPAPIPEVVAAIPPIADSASETKPLLRLAEKIQVNLPVHASPAFQSPEIFQAAATASARIPPVQTGPATPPTEATPPSSKIKTPNTFHPPAIPNETAAVPARRIEEILPNIRIDPSSASRASDQARVAPVIVNSGVVAEVDKQLSGQPSPQKVTVPTTAEFHPVPPENEKAKISGSQSQNSEQAVRIDFAFKDAIRTAAPKPLPVIPLGNSPDQAAAHDQSRDKPTMSREASNFSAPTPATGPRLAPTDVPVMPLPADSRPATVALPATGLDDGFQPASTSTATPEPAQRAIQQPLVTAQYPGPSVNPGSTSAPKLIAKDIVAATVQAPASMGTAWSVPPASPPIAVPIDSQLLDANPRDADSTAFRDFATETTKSDSPRDFARIISDPKLPRHLGAQLAQIARQMPDGPVELSLNPEELGRVRMSLNATDSAITVNLTVERPETADLMRRNLQALEAEFRDLGYVDVSFSFSGDTAQNEHPDGRQTGDGLTGNDPAYDPENVPTPTPQSMQTSGMDLRL